MNFFTVCFEHFHTLHGIFTACSRPSIFLRKIYFYTAYFELFGGGHGHLAILAVTITRSYVNCTGKFLFTSWEIFGKNQVQDHARMVPHMYLKVLTNEKRGGIKVIAFYRSPFKLFTLRFSKKSVNAPSSERPQTTQRTLLLSFEINNCLQITT